MTITNTSRPDNRRLTRDYILTQSAVIIANSPREFGAASREMSANNNGCHSHMSSLKHGRTLGLRPGRCVGYPETKYHSLVLWKRSQLNRASGLSD